MKSDYCKNISKKRFSFHADGSQCLQGSGAVCQARTAGWRKRLQMHQVSFLQTNAIQPRAQERASVLFGCLFMSVCQITNQMFVSFRCKKMVTASKRFTIHRSANVLTLSLKRFANFSGGKITKVLRHVWTLLPRTTIWDSTHNTVI